jgi:YVTN family beta-propeller protein
MDGATDSLIAEVYTGGWTRALCYNPRNNKVYAANSDIGTVIVIDGASNSVLATDTVGTYPSVLCYESLYNKVYCANRSSANVTVIDGATNRVLGSIGVGARPWDLVWSPANNRVYVANFDSSSISVMRDTGGGVWVEDDSRPRATSCKPAATVVRGVLFLPETSDHTPQAASWLLDITGRKVLDLKPGANDVRALAAGVYFVREASGVKRGASRVRKLVVTR